ncbi:hypothetical protein SAY87_000520 [Trapa incisa]|uniref:Scarecrow-like protein 23 n=1 Tax=Trapa incisa TaxID=236973 RepID=A0AAN7GIW7_9MYRT|nr:hypothetical protein SAY87_000520 [Trapa incisa]
MRGVCGYGQPRRRHRPPPGDLRPLLSIRFVTGAGSGVLLRRAAGPRGELLPRNLLPSGQQGAEAGPVAKAIFQALEGEDRVHVIDLDIMQGLQWPGLFHILASRPQKIRSMRVTGFGPSLELLQSTGRQLADFASSFGLPFEYTPIEGKIGSLTDPGQLGLRSGEATVIHWMHHSLYDVTGSDAGTLRLLGMARPKLVTIVEQDLSHGGSFLSRFVEALHYYSALFDAVGDGMDDHSVERHAVEQQLFGSEIRNIVAVGGPKRTGEVKVDRWGEELGRMGFRPVSLDGSPAAQASLLLGMYPWKGYTLVEEGGCLKLGWKDLSLLTASAWEPSE